MVHSSSRGIGGILSSDIAPLDQGEADDPFPFPPA
jgi:hypothetical protein